MHDEPTPGHEVPGCFIVRRKPYPSFVQALGLIGYVIVFSVAIVVVFYFVRGLDAPGDPMDVVTYVGSLLLTIAIANRSRKRRQFALGTVPFGLYVLILFLVPAHAIVIHPAIDLIPMTEWGERLFAGMRPSSFGMVALVIVAAPILEELLFRGIILDGFLKRYNPWKAILLSSILFGFIHLNPWQFINAFSIGMVMGWLYWKTGSLMPCIFLHFVNNTLATIGSLTPRGNVDLGDAKFPPGFDIWFIAGVVALAIILFVIKKIVDVRPDDQFKTENA